MKHVSASLLSLAALLLSTSASAHVDVAGTPYAGTTQVLTFGISHGCDGADTVKVKVRIPEGVTSVRPLDSTFGKATVERQNPSDPASPVVAVTWTKAESLAEDSHYYPLALRARLPNTPFRTLHFPTTQTCRTAGGEERVTEWVGTGDHAGHDPAAGAAAEEPAPAVVLQPSRQPGWNKYMVQEHLHDLSVFKDAQIVWSGSAAYSANPNTQALIAEEPDTQVLEHIHPGTEIWVKY